MKSFRYAKKVFAVNTANTAAEQENAALRKIHGVARGFLAHHPAFSSELAQKIVGVVETGFVYAAGLFPAGWDKKLVMSTPELQAKETRARLLLSNLRRVRTLLVAEGYRREDDPQDATLLEETCRCLADTNAVDLPAVSIPAQRKIPCDLESPKFLKDSRKDNPYVLF